MLGMFPLAAAPVSGGFFRGQPPVGVPGKRYDTFWYYANTPGAATYAPPGPDARYDLMGAYDSFAAGFFWSRGDYDAMYAAWAANGFQPLNGTQVVAAIVAVDGPQPALVTAIRQLPGYDDAPLYFAPQPAGTIGGP